jgi:hypothetical protein
MDSPYPPRPVRQEAVNDALDARGALARDVRVFGARSEEAALRRRLVRSACRMLTTPERTVYVATVRAQTVRTVRRTAR